MMRIRVLIALLFFTGILNAAVFTVSDTIIIRSDINTEKITADLDSLVNSWYVKMALAE